MYIQIYTFIQGVIFKLKVFFTFLILSYGFKH
jgi:hypothetical protein